MKECFPELSVSGDDLKACGDQRSVCVSASADCLSASEALSASSESFVNTSCHFLVQERLLTCRWTDQSDDQTETSSFIFRRSTDISDCSSIIYYDSLFHLIIKSTSVIGQERFSDVYPVIIKEIVQAPRPVITSVNVTDSSLNVTWNSGPIDIHKCRIRYKRLNAESWTETADFPASSESLFVIEGLPAFSEYGLSVSCVHYEGRWSDWSSETRVRTSESPPSASPSLSYYVASDGDSGLRRLLLLWKALDVTDARGLIRGYEVSYMPTKQPSLKKTIHTTELKAVFGVRAEEYEVTARAYNSAGRSPPRRLRIDASRSHSVRSVKALWAYSDGSELRLRWGRDPSANISEFAIEWSAATTPDLKHWLWVDGSTLTTPLPGVDVGELYSISVFPVCGPLCGPAASLSADLQHGALLDLVGFRLVSVSCSSLEVQWTWTEGRPRVSVVQYQLELRGAAAAQSLSLSPDQNHHSFLQLRPNSRYSVHIRGQTSAGNFSKASLDVLTPLIDSADLLRVAVPVLLLLLVLGVFSVSSLTVFRKRFFPIIANPRDSLIGHWLLAPHLQAGGKLCVLQLESVSPLEQQSFLQVEGRLSLMSPLEDEICPALRTSSADALPQHVAAPAPADRSDYVQNGQIVSQFFFEKSSD